MSYDSKDTLIRLWANEVHRVFGDRLTNDADRETFGEILKCGQ